MKKILNSIFKLFKSIFKIIYKIIDVLIVTPISKLIYFVSDKLSAKNSNLEKFLNNPNSLVYIALIFAFASFLAVDKKVINLAQTESLVLTNQKIVAEYNEEAFVIEGIPESADIVLMGRKSDLYLAEQLGDHKLTLDLTGHSAGTYKVSLKYNNPINTLDYKLDPSKITVVIHPKVSASKTVTSDVVNTDKLGDKLVVDSVTLDRDEVIVKSYEKRLGEVATVKALVDVNTINATKAGTYNIDNVKLVAYDEKGTELPDIEIVPGTISAVIKISSPSKVVPIKIVPVGDVANGNAISSITSNVTNVTLYGDQSALKDIDEISIEIDVNDLNSDKTYQETINKPIGVRSMSDTAATIKVKLSKETSKEFKNIPLTFKNLNSKYRALAASADETKVTVSVKGVSTLIKKLDAKDIEAYVDLSNLTPGEYDIPVMVTGSDLKLSYSSKTTKVRVKILKK